MSKKYGKSGGKKSVALLMLYSYSTKYRVNHLNNPLSFSSIRSLIHTLGESFDGCGVISSIVNVARGNRQPLDLYLAETKAEDGIVQQNVGSLQICKRFMI